MHLTSLFHRPLLVAAALGLFSGLSLAADQPRSVWPQAASDISTDPAIRLGALPNGMRYAIMKNATPKGAVSIRFRIGAGSLQETEEQRGLAHFVEHMAFRGSTHVPDGEVFKLLQRLGLRTGADANATTGLTETVYQFDLPKNDEETLDTGLMLSRDIASELAFNPEGFEAEIGRAHV